MSTAHLLAALPTAFCNSLGCAQAGWAAAQSKLQCAVENCKADAQCIQKLTYLAAAVQCKLSKLQCNRHHVFNWDVLECRRQLLEGVQGIWQSARHSRRGQSYTLRSPRLSDCMGAEPVEVVHVILDALKKEEACL